MARFRRMLVVVAAVAGCGKGGLPSDWVTVPTRASHVYFPIAVGFHAAADCNSCHGTYDTFKKFDCSTSGCHVQPQIAQLHVTVTGFASDGPSCLGCHSDGTVAFPTHDTAFFPRGGGSVHSDAGVGCTQCHLNLSTPTDPTTLACVSCHSTLPTGWPHPDPVSGVAILVITTSTSPLPNLVTTQTPIDPTVNANCLRCHADSQVNTVASHPAVDGSPNQNGAHGDAGCLTCHPAMRADKPFGADFSVTGAPGSGTGCGVCHATPP